ncbi:MAG: flagellin lysine-N-methylase [Oscillospiraceae bacterium]|nr:flagellin lysine-N-methylase [Oscillospiraceae bacterium]
MKLRYPHFYKDFQCIAEDCSDNCCRQGWLIPIDDAHVEYYENYPDPLGARIRETMKKIDGQWYLAPKDGVCPLLEEGGLCPLVRASGEEALCHICHSHPRFLEEYGLTREIHVSLSCPEMARLALEGTDAITYEEEMTDEPLSSPNDIDPQEYFALLEIREFCLRLVQHRELNIYDRMALLLQFARRVQPLLDEGEYALCKPLIHLFTYAPQGRRQLLATKRARKKGCSYFAERELLSSLEHLAEDWENLLKATIFTARDGAKLDENCPYVLEHLLTLWLGHYIPKAVCDGRVDTKIRFAVLMVMAVRRLCLCHGEENLAFAEKMAGCLAREVEHSQDNMEKVYRTLSSPLWHEHLMMGLPLK